MCRRRSVVPWPARRGWLKAQLLAPLSSFLIVECCLPSLGHLAMVAERVHFLTRTLSRCNEATSEDLWRVLISFVALVLTASR